MLQKIDRFCFTDGTRRIGRIVQEHIWLLVSYGDITYKVALYFIIGDCGKLYNCLNISVSFTPRFIRSTLIFLFVCKQIK